MHISEKSLLKSSIRYRRSLVRVMWKLRRYAQLVHNTTAVPDECAIYAKEVKKRSEYIKLLIGNIRREERLLVTMELEGGNDA